MERHTVGQPDPRRISCPEQLAKRVLASRQRSCQGRPGLRPHKPACIARMAALVMAAFTLTTSSTRPCQGLIRRRVSCGAMLRYGPDGQHPPDQRECQQHPDALVVERLQ